MLKLPLSSSEPHFKSKHIEPTSPNATKAFFKTVNHWTQLSGYMGHFLSSDNSISTSPQLLKFQKRPIEISQNVHEARVETAINYLVLRDLGCSRENAMSLTSRKRPDNASFVKSLPKQLQRDFITKINKSNCLPCRPPTTYEEFDSISGAFKDLIIKRQAYIEPVAVEHVKTIEKLEEKKERVEERKNFLKQQKNRVSCIKRVIVPDIKDFSKHVKAGNNLSNLQLTYDSTKLIKSPGIISPKNDFFSRYIEKFDNSRQLENLEKTKSNGRADRSHKISINSLSHDVKSVTNRSEQPKTTCAKSSTDQSSINFHSVYNNHSKTESSNDFEIRVQSDTKSETDLSEIDYAQLIDEDKKLINLIRIQKYRQAQMRGEEYKKALQKIKARKKMQDEKTQELKLKNFEKKKEKIFLAKLKKDNLLLKRQKQQFLKLSTVKTP